MAALGPEKARRSPSRAGWVAQRSQWTDTGRSVGGDGGVGWRWLRGWGGAFGYPRVEAVCDHFGGHPSHPFCPNEGPKPLSERGKALEVNAVIVSYHPSQAVYP